jgi:superfamily II helicase
MDKGKLALLADLIDKYKEHMDECEYLVSMRMLKSMIDKVTDPEPPKDINRAVPRKEHCHR